MKTESDDLTPYTGSWGDAQIWHLLRRTMFGVPESQFLAAKTLGSMSAVVSKLLEARDVTKVPLPNKPAPWVDVYPTVTNGMSTDDMINRAVLQANEIQQLENWWFDQMMQEQLSIRQKMTLLWTNHFVTGSQTVLLSSYVYTYLMTCMTNALGNFKDFAAAISIDPNMLVYLNGNQNFVLLGESFVNENYARELMELFTLGLNDPKTGKPNYSEDDVQNSARALTGWQPTQTGPFVGNFNIGLHDTTPKTFLGHTGNWALSDILGFIFEQGTPAGYTAAYLVCQKLYQEFVYYKPNASIVDAMATVMLANDFEIAPVMEALLSSAHFYDTNIIGAQIKSPIEFMGTLVREFALSYPAFDPTDPPVISTANGLDTYGDPNPTLSILTYLSNIQGQQLLNPPNVKGWSGGENWLSAGAFLNREEYSYGILNNALVNSANKWDLPFDPSLYAEQVPNAGSLTAGELTQALLDLSLAFTLGPIEMATLDPNPNLSQDVIDTTIPNFANGLVQLPEFQLY